MRAIFNTAMLALVLVGVGVTLGCTTQTSSECSQLHRAEKLLADTQDRVAEQYDESYFSTAEWTAYVDGYWSGFWKQHKHCKICQANGDVPAEYQ